MKAKKLLLGIVLAIAILSGCWWLLAGLAPKPVKLTEEERMQLALSIVKGYKVPRVGETVEEMAKRSEREGFSITWHVERERGDWYKVWFTGVAEDGRRCGSALFYVNVSTGEVRIEKAVEV